MTEVLSYLNCAIRVVGGRPWDSRWSFTLSVKESAEVLPGCGWRVGWQRRPFRPIGAAPLRKAHRPVADPTGLETNSHAQSPFGSLESN